MVQLTKQELKHKNTDNLVVGNTLYNRKKYWIPAYQNQYHFIFLNNKIP